MDVFCWIRNPKLSSWNFSPMWWGFMKIFHCFKNDLIWQVGTGELICVGIDPIIGMEDHYTLPSSITRYLQILGLSTLNKIYLCRNGVEDSTKWMSASDLGLSGYLARAWDAYILNLNSVGVRLNQDLDQLVWGGNPASGFVTAKSAYSRIVQDKYIYPQDWWYKRLWYWAIPLKLKCFSWLLLQDKLKTWENLCKRGWIGPSLCVLCKNEAETKQHLFVKCSFTIKIWDVISSNLNITQCWDVGDFNKCLLNWFRHCKQHFYIAICIPWAIWYSRNSAIFRNATPDILQCSLTALNMFALCKEDDLKMKIDRVSYFNFKVDQPVLFFDGASQSGLCAIGGVIYLNESHYYTNRLNCGVGSNMKAELMALWCILKVANSFGLVNIKVYGDSRVTIKWDAGEFRLNVMHLRH